VTQSVAIVISTDGLETDLIPLTVFTSIASLKKNQYLCQGIQNTSIPNLYKNNFRFALVSGLCKYDLKNKIIDNLLIYIPFQE